MITTRRSLPYTKHLVRLALYDVLEQEGGEYSGSEPDGGIAFTLAVYGNSSDFFAEITEKAPSTELLITITRPHAGLSGQGSQRAVDYIADRVEQLLENELLIIRYQKKGETRE